MHRLISLASLAVVVAACSVTPTPTPLGSGLQPGPTAPERAAGTVSGHGMTLSAAAEPAVVAAGERIEVEATVTNDGAEPIVLSGSGSGFVFFSVTRVEDGLTSGEPVMTDDCAPHVVNPGEPIAVPFAKSGGWSEDDPNAAFLRTYFSEPELSLPSGTWRIDVTVHATMGEGCTGPPVDLELALIVTVTE
ncbi:MAG TPA: hypothetical protein VLA59_09355 [Patescibacteria group bacterium]|nr:hypothetical protein [Patescibacteria group bacterium]